VTGLTGFAVDEARSTQEARQCLQEASRSKRPYEVVLLDLQLPATDQDAKDGKALEEHGRDLLAHITSAFDAAVVILTGFPKPVNFIHAVREGAADFLVKPLETREDEKMLFARLLNAVGKTGEIVHRKLRARRLLWLEDHDRRSDRERFARLVSEKVGRISDELHLLTETLSRRYGLDRRHNAEDTVCRYLAAIEATGNDLVQQAWKSVEEEEPACFEKVDVAVIMAEQIDRARPCYLHRGVGLEWTGASEGELQTKTFPEDLRLMIAELVLGTLETAPRGSVVELSGERSDEGKDIVIAASRSGKAIPKGVQVSLRKGNWVHETAEGNWQGLYFLQRIANNIGARLEIDSGDEKTIVALRIPVTENA
jgi:ActR/RegA family two-component response regulator